MYLDVLGSHPSQQRWFRHEPFKFFVFEPGVDVMITIFCDFRQFSVKKLAFFPKTNVMITIFSKTSSSLDKKRQFFR
jgi:hypothetical protein